jgi:hypothetical protein
MCTTHATSLIYTPDPATNFIRSAGITPNYIYYASYTHTTTTTQLHYPHIPSSSNKQSTSPNTDFSEAEESTDIDENGDRLSWQKSAEEARKEQVRYHQSINTQKE